MPKKSRTADAANFDSATQKMRQRWAIRKQRQEMGHATTILPGWETPPTIKPRQPRAVKFGQHLGRFGSFLTGEANRFLRNAEAAARRVEKAGKTQTKIVYRSSDQVVGGQEKPEPEGKKKKGYRVGRVARVGDPIVKPIDETWHKTPSFTNMEYLYGHTYRNPDTKPAKGIRGEKMRDVSAFVKAKPEAVAQYMFGRRMKRLKATDPKRYQTEKTVAVGAAAGLLGWKGYKIGKKLYKEYMDFQKGL